MSSRPIPTPSLVVLIGPPASGKSTWAAANFRPEQIVSADALRNVVGEHALDLAATADAFDVLDRIVAARLRRGLTTVIDTTGLDEGRRAAYVAVGRHSSVSTVAVRFTTTAAECKRRNRERQHPVPTKAIDQMVKKAKALDLSSEDWDLEIEPEPVRSVTRKLIGAVDAVTAKAESGASSRTRMRVGLLISSFDWAGGTDAIGPTLTRIAQEAEAAGVDSLWVMDHLIQIPQVGRTWDPLLESYTTLAHIAAVTERIRVGVLVSPVTFHHVARLAKLIATLDVLSGGRAIVGLGAGSSEHEHRVLGIAFGSARERLALLEDTVGALRALLGPGGKRFESATISLEQTALYPRPIQERIPIIVGGSGEQVTLRIAAEHGDGSNLFGDAETVRRKVGRLLEHCEAAGRDPTEVEITHLGTALIGLDARDLRARVKQLRPSDVGPDRYSEHANAGTVDDHVASLERLREAGVQTAILSLPDIASPGSLSSLAAVITRL